MIFKVYYQDEIKEPPVREKTNALYVEAETEREVRYKLKDKSYNIEIIKPLTGEALAYEQQSESFKVLEI